MATITNISPAASQNLQGATAFGNLAVLRYSVQTNAIGALVNSDSREPLQTDDVLRLGIIPAGFRIFDVMIIVNEVMTGGDAKVGFAYCDGVDVAETPQNSGIFGDPLATDSYGKYRVGGSVKSFVLPKNAFLTLTVGNDNDRKSWIEIFLYAIVEGSV